MADQIIWAKQTTEGRQVTNDGSELINFFYVPVEDTEDGKSPGILYGTPGFDSFATVPSLGSLSSAVHGMIAIDSPDYGRRLFGISQGVNFFELRAGSSLPTIRAFTNSTNEAYTGPARLASDGRHVAFLRGRSVVMWDQESGSFVQVYSPVATNPQELLHDEDWVDVVWVKGYFVLLAKTGEIFHSQLHSVDFDQLDFATAERNPDPGVGLAKFQGRFYVFGSQSIEIYRETGAFPFAFGRVGDSAIPFGCLARDTIQVNEAGVFFLGHDKSFYVTVGSLPIKLSNATVDYDIAQSSPSLSRGYVYTEEGRRFYSLILTFPDGTKKNWTIDLVSRLWHQRTNTRILCAEAFEGKNVVGLDNSRIIMDQSLNHGDENGALVGKTAVGSLIHNNRRAISFQSVFFDVPKFPLPSGITDHGTFMLDWSDDGKVTFGEVRQHNLSNAKLRSNLLGATVAGRNFRVRVSSRRRVQIEATYLKATPLAGYGL